MKILSIGYYDDFARFYLEIKKEFKKKDTQVQFKYLSLYLSGYLYFLVRLQDVSFFSFKVWMNIFFNKSKYRNIIKENKVYKGIDLDKIIKYHLLLDREEKINLKLQAVSYINTVEALLLKFQPDVIILSGDSRMSIEILNLKAKELNIETYYFEQGPFGTTIFDREGVNAHASLREKELNSLNNDKMAEKEQNIKNFFARKRYSKYNRYPFYRGLDYIFQYICSFLGLLPVDIKMEKRADVCLSEYKNLSYDLHHKDKKIFLLILQVPYDVNMVYHSPFFRNHFDIVKNVYKNLPVNSHLLVREHPLYKGRYENELYRFMLVNNISLNTEDLYKSIDKADVIIVNNSTVGIEAISKEKTVVVLGDAYYDNDLICLKLKNEKNLDKLLEKGLQYKPQKEYIISFLDNFLNYYLINGHFRDSNLVAPQIITNQILKQGEKNV